MHSLPHLIALMEHALVLVVALSLPVVASAAVASLCIGLLQSLTQIHDGALTHLARLLAVALALSLGGAWIAEELARFARQLLRG